MKHLNNFWLLFLLFCCSQAKSQLALNILAPTTGFVQKQQLWNLLVTNTNAQTASVRIQIVITDKASGQQVLTAASGPILLAPGISQLTSSTVGAVQYNVVNPSFGIDPGPVGPLPPGTFNACYTVATEAGKQFFQDCQSIDVQPIGPLLLAAPVDKAVVGTATPLFNWLPLAGLPSFSSLSYGMRLVEVYPGQSPPDALRDNLPVYTANQLTATNIFYNSSASPLQKGKIYAWQVTAGNGAVSFAKSETWTFRLQDSASTTEKSGTGPFVKLKKEVEGGAHAIAYGHLRFAYLNETSDTAWSYELTELGPGRHGAIRLRQLDTNVLHRGENLVDIDGSRMSALKEKRVYSLKIRNSRQETWQLKFEYRKED